MVKLNINLPEHFLEEEIRNEYTVTAQIKQVWAVELDLLKQLNTVCETLHISYCACGGTLLGAVRHQGFIPWDDDIDVAMKREDFCKLCQAHELFLPPYELQFFDKTEGYFTGHAQLRNTQTTAALDIFMNSRSKVPFNQGIFIDIFPLDALPDEPAKRKALCRKILKLRNAAKRAYRLKEGYIPEKATSRMKFLHALFQLFPFVSYQKLYSKFIETCTKYNHQTTEYLTMLSFMPENEKLWIKRENFNHITQSKFEFITIPIEKNYDEVLKTQYGNYQTPVKGGCYHGGVIFDTDQPFSQWIKSHQNKL